MLIPHNIFNDIFLIPILNLLVGLYKLFTTIHFPWAFGWALIVLVVMVRTLLHPFFKQQIQASKKMQEMKPHLDKLAAKHKGNPKQLQAEQMKLYQEMGINPATGCLLMIIQIPIFIALYSTMNVFLRNGITPHVIGDINKVLYFPFLHLQNIDLHFFGINLAISPSKSGIWFYYLIPVVTAILQYYQAQASMPMMVPTQPQLAPAKDGKDEKKTSNSEDFQKAMNTQMKYMFPLLIGWAAYSFPTGIALYYNIFSLFSIFQYKRIHSQAEAIEKDIEEIEKGQKKDKKKNKAK